MADMKRKSDFDKFAEGREQGAKGEGQRAQSTERRGQGERCREFALSAV
jgi:hypothetical protein